MKQMVVCDPPDTDNHEAQNVTEEFWGHRHEAALQSSRNILVLHLGNVNLQNEESDDDREDPIAERLNPGGWHFADPENSGETFLQTFLVFGQTRFGQCRGWNRKRYPGPQMSPRSRILSVPLLDARSGRKSRPQR
jgi:hypothetical protein